MNNNSLKDFESNENKFDKRSSSTEDLKTFVKAWLYVFRFLFILIKSKFKDVWIYEELKAEIMLVKFLFTVDS